jgi:hypothetical protein
VSDGADRRPHVSCVTLGTDPRLQVVRDHRRGEPDALGLVDETTRVVLPARQ